MSDTGFTLYTAVKVWKDKQTKANWDKVLAAASKHELSKAPRDKWDDNHSGGTLDESQDILNLSIPQEKRIEILRNCK